MAKQFMIILTVLGNFEVVGQNEKLVFMLWINTV